MKYVAVTAFAAALGAHVALADVAAAGNGVPAGASKTPYTHAAVKPGCNDVCTAVQPLFAVHAKAGGKNDARNIARRDAAKPVTNAAAGAGRSYTYLTGYLY